jgi:hypothetical protein
VYWPIGFTLLQVHLTLTLSSLNRKSDIPNHWYDKFKKPFFEARNQDFFKNFQGILCFLLSRLPLAALVLHPYNIDLLGFGDTLCCFSHQLLTAQSPKISGTTPVKNMKIRLCQTIIYLPVLEEPLYKLCRWFHLLHTVRSTYCYC